MKILQFIVLTQNTGLLSNNIRDSDSGSKYE